MFDIIGPEGETFRPPPNRYWRCNEKQFSKWVDDDRIWWGVNGDARPMLKAFLSESTRGIKPHTWWDHESAGHNKEATLELKALFDGDAPFDTPKPVKLIRRLIDLLPDTNGIVLDFFSGSSATGQAVMEANRDDGGRRRHIAVQISEAIEPTSGGLTNIAEIGRERLSRAAANIAVGDTGFRVLKIDSSNFKDVRAAPDATTQGSLLDRVDNLKDDRSGEDLLFGVLLDWGVDLGLPIAREEVAGREVFLVDTDALAACFEPGLDEDFMKALAARKPLRAVFRDASYGSDAAKINAVQLLRQLSPATEVRTLLPRESADRRPFHPKTADGPRIRLTVGFTRRNTWTPPADRRHRSLGVLAVRGFSARGMMAVPDD